MKLINVEPIRDQIITTARKYNEAQLTQNGILLDVTKVDNAYMEVQTIEQVGPDVEEKYHLKAGDSIMIDPTRFIYYKSHEGKPVSAAAPTPVKETKVIGWPIITFGENDEEHMLLRASDAMFKVTSFKM